MHNIDNMQRKSLLKHNSAQTVLENTIESMDYQKALAYALILAIGNGADAIEITSVGYIMEEMGGISDIEKEWLSASVFMGMLVGGIWAGFFADSFGRRPCLLTSLGLNFCGAIGSFFASSHVNLLIMCRIIGGVGIGGSVPVVFTLGSELFPTESRGKLLTVIASFWMVGSIYTALIGWLMLGNDINGDKMIPSESGGNWHIFILVCSIPVLLGLILTYVYIPESPAYLLTKGQYSEFYRVIHEIDPNQAMEMDCHENANYEDATDRFNPMIESNYDSTCESNSHELVAEHDDATHESTSDIFKNPIYRSNMLSLVFIWYSLSFGTYGIIIWINVIFDNMNMFNTYMSSFLFAVANIPGNMFSYYYVDVFGRRKILLYGMLLSALAGVGFAIGSYFQDDSDDNPNHNTNSMIANVFVILCAMLYSACSVSGWNSLDCMSVETFPSFIRPTSMGILAAFGRIGAITAQFVFGALEHQILLLLCIVSCLMLVGAYCCTLLPETTGRKLSTTGI